MAVADGDVRRIREADTPRAAAELDAVDDEKTRVDDVDDVLAVIDVVKHGLLAAGGAYRYRLLCGAGEIELEITRKRIGSAVHDQRVAWTEILHRASKIIARTDLDIRSERDGAACEQSRWQQRSRRDLEEQGHRDFSGI